MKSKEPYYTIDFTAVECNVEILVNDISVASFEVEGQISPNLPINYAIGKSGKQNITIKLLPLQGRQFLDASTEFSYTLRLFDVTDNQFTFIEDVSSLYTFEKTKAEDKKANQSHSAFFNAEVPYKMMLWEDSRDLLTISDDKDYVIKKLDKAYNEILEILKHKKFDIFYDRVKNRETNMALSMYLDKEEADSRINSLINDMNNGFEVIDLPIDRMMKIYGYGKLATYKKINGEPALYLFNKNTGEEIMLEFMFHIPQGREDFEII